MLCGKLTFDDNLFMFLSSEKQTKTINIRIISCIEYINLSSLHELLPKVISDT